MPDLPADTIRRPLKVHHLSHDLRGPLSSILGFAELLLDGVEGPLNEIQTEDIAAIRQSAANLLQLVDNIVDLSKLEEDQPILTFEPVDLETVIEAVLDSDLTTGRSGPVEVVAKLPGSLPQLWADPNRVEQMLLSLVRFAGDLSPRGQVNIGLDSRKTDALFQITAVGAVPAPEEFETLFELEVYTDAAGRSKLGPGGLDLPLVDRLAREHQGEVRVESRDELGVVFWLRLPLRTKA